MPKYIDAYALGIGEANRAVFDNPKYADGWNSAIEIIENAPTADVEEVVRCKDCKHRYSETCFSRHETAEMDFCSCGAKMDLD